MSSRFIPLFIRTTQADPSQDPFAKLVPATAGRFGNLYATAQDPITGLLASVHDVRSGPVVLPGNQPGGLASLSITFGYAPGSQDTLNGVNAVPLAAAFDPAQVTGLATAANLRLFDGASMVTAQTATDNADDQASLGNTLLAAIARLQAFDGAAWDRLRTASAANLSAQSAVGALLSTRPGDWSAHHVPAANVQATATRAPGGVGVRHVCTSISARLMDPTSLITGTAVVNLRDGATGAGAVLWSTRLMLLLSAANVTAQPSDRIELSGLNIVGSANTAMTLEFAGAGGAGTFEAVAMTGYSAPG